MKRYTDKTYHDLKGIAHTAFSEEVDGEWCKHEDIPKKLTIEELREGFEVYYKHLNPEMDKSELKFHGIYICCRVQELWVYYIGCARANNLIKGGKHE